MSPEPNALHTALDVPITYNFREVAAGTLRPGTLYRSDALHRLNATGRRTLADLGIRLVIDLRSPFDRRLGGRDRLRGVDAEYLSIPMTGTRGKVDTSTIDLRGVYRTMLEHHHAEIGSAIRAIADADGPVIVHCTAGKDRTGLISALTLFALGFDAIVASDDYRLSEGNLAGEWTDRMLRKARRFRVPLTEQLLEVMSRSPEAVLLETLEWLESERGGVHGYLDAAGVDDDVRARLSAALVET